MKKFYMGCTNLTAEESKDIKETLANILSFETNHYTNDYPELCQFNSHYVFVYGEHKANFRKGSYFSHATVNGVGYSKISMFKMYRTTNHPTTPVAIVGKWDLKSGSSETNTGRIYGEVYQIDPSYIRDYDYEMSNNVYYKRARIPIDVIGRDGKSRQVYAWTYLGLKSYWENHTDKLIECDLLAANKNKNFKYYSFMRKYELE